MVEKLKSYSESKGAEVFDWFEYLEFAKSASRKDLENGHNVPNGSYFPSYDKAIELANGWVTCACGQQCAKLPRTSNAGITGLPVDSKLRHYGIDFSDAVAFKDFEEAIEILRKIEKRSAELLAELEKNEQL